MWTINFHTHIKQQAKLWHNTLKTEKNEELKTRLKKKEKKIMMEKSNAKNENDQEWKK
jgi:hypothetical protein